MKETYYNLSVQKAMQIVDAISHEPGGMTLAEVCRATGLNKSVAYRLLLTLESGSWLRRDQANRFNIGLKLVALNTVALDNIGFRDILAPYMKALEEKTGETVVLAMYCDYQVVCIEKYESNHNLRISAQVGRRFPLEVGATGLSVLMGMDDSVVDEVLAHRRNSLLYRGEHLDIAAVKGQLQQARKQGYIMTVGTVDEDVAGIGVPISFLPEKQYFGLSVVLPAYRMDKEKERRIVEALMEVLATIQTAK